MSGRVERVPLSRDDSRIIASLGCCSFLPGSADKRFVRNAQSWTGITAKQRNHLYRLRWKYRRQISATCPLPWIPPPPAAESDGDAPPPAYHPSPRS